MLTSRLARRTAALAVVAVTALAGCSTGSGTKSQSGDQQGYVEGKANGVKHVAVGSRDNAPSISGKGVDGVDLTLADYKGKVVVINIWGSWCGPCRGEAPTLQKVSQDLAPQGVQFLGINSRDASTDNAKAFERKFGVTYPSISDPEGSMVLKFRGPLYPSGLPATYVVDRDGKIASYFKGQVDEDTLRGMINPVLNGS
jgi:thiol-disulfide isomerase/thioredoxin